MSQGSFVEFLSAARRDAAMLAAYDQRNLSQLLFHARNDGYDFTAADAAAVIGALETNVIVAKDGDPYDENSRLWRQMWGRRRLGYLVDRVAARHTDAELSALVSAGTDAS